MLLDCVSKDPSQNELLILRDGPHSAIAKSMRNRMTQAIFTMDATIVNTVSAGLEEVLKNDQFLQIIAAIGAGIEFPDFPDSFRLSHARYGRVIIAFENSSDGATAREHLISFFHLYMSPLIEEGMIYQIDSEGVARGDLVRVAIDSIARKLIRVEPDSSGI